MSTSEILGVLFLAFFASNAVLLRSAGLDPAERFSREPRRVFIFAAVITSSALVSHIAAFTILTHVMPALEISSSTLLDGTVIVFSVMTSSAALGEMAKRWWPRVVKKLDGEIFSIGYNSAVTGIVLLCRAASTNFVKSLIYCLSFSASVVLVYFAISIWRLDMKEYKIPRTFRGAPILFILLGLAAMVLECYAGASLPQ